MTKFVAVMKFVLEYKAFALDMFPFKRLSFKKTSSSNFFASMLQLVHERRKFYKGLIPHVVHNAFNLKQSHTFCWNKTTQTIAQNDANRYPNKAAEIDLIEVR